MQCPYCEHIFFAGSASDSGEPDFRPGVICPGCSEFIDDEELDKVIPESEREEH